MEKVPKFPNIKIHRYAEDMPVWLGYVEPETGKWLLFIDKQGGAHLYVKEDTGYEFVAKVDFN